MDASTEKIDRYLMEEMSPEERAAFEKELANSASLKEEFDAQKALTEQLQRMGIKGEIAQTMNQIRLVKFLSVSAIIVVVALILGLAVYILNDRPEKPPLDKYQATEVSLPIESIKINTEKDTIIETNGGMMLAIPAGAFDTEKESVELQIQEAFAEVDIIKAGLSTTSNGELLQTAGMFSVRAFDGKQELQWKKKVSMLIPTEEVDPDMMLFNGEILEDGTVNWVNPVKIDNDLPLVDIHSLDFYPQNFIPTLKSIGEPINNKAYTDSIYYSFSGFTFDYVMQDQIENWDGTQILSEGWTPTKGDDLLATLSDTVAVAPSEQAADAVEAALELDPSRIKAIWNDDFAKTLLATRAFEERLRFIHTTCRPDFLEAYVSHLDLKMWEIDSLCMTMASGAHKERFREFYLRKDGGVKLSNALAKSLATRYENKQKAWKDAVSAVWKAHYKELDSLAMAAALRREEFNYKDAIREITVFGDELCRNMKDAYQQIGGKAYCNEP